MDFTVYILYSKSHNKIYIGYTSNLVQRFYSHNHLGTKGFTIRYRPWEVIYTEVFDVKSIAMQREKQLKSGNGRAWVWTKISSEFSQNGFISAA